jgi:glycerol kinase
MTRDLAGVSRASAKKRGTRESSAGARRARPVRVLRVDGGAAANDFLMQYQADLLGVPVERPRMIETTALGAALLAGLASGVWAAQQDAARARAVERVFKPERGRAWREAEYARWKTAVRAVLTT